MDVTTAISRFETSTRRCDDLIGMNQVLTGKGAGRRVYTSSLNRAAVVLAVAAWQALVEDLVQSIVDAARPLAAQQAPAMTLDAWHLLDARLKKDIYDFANADVYHIRALFRLVGVEDIRKEWAWGNGRGKYDATRAKKELDAWWKVRCNVAHGNTLLPHAVLRSVKKDGKVTDIRKRDAVEVTRFMRAIGQATAKYVAVLLGQPIPDLIRPVYLEEYK